MKTDGGPVYRAKAFADKAGVTVRTLHVYDRGGRLKPAARTDSGYRLYGEPELGRLEQILALRLQREIVRQQMSRLELAIEAIEEAERALSADRDADRWETLRTIMEAFKMKSDWSWTQNYYTDEDRAKVAERMPEFKRA